MRIVNRFKVGFEIYASEKNGNLRRMTITKKTNDKLLAVDFGSKILRSIRKGW